MVSEESANTLNMVCFYNVCIGGRGGLQILDICIFWFSQLRSLRNFALGILRNFSVERPLIVFWFLCIFNKYTRLKYINVLSNIPIIIIFWQVCQFAICQLLWKTTKYANLQYGNLTKLYNMWINGKKNSLEFLEHFWALNVKIQFL